MNTHIEALRDQVANMPQPRRLTVDEVTAVVDGLQDCRSLAEVSERSGLSTGEVLDLVAGFGTWLTHVYGGSGAKTVQAVEQSQPSLFQPTKTSSKSTDAPVVAIPAGFEKSAEHRRDVSKALASIVVHAPDVATVTRYLARSVPSQARVLTASHIHTVWNFARLGRIDEIGEISPENPVFCEMLVAAFDTLDVARSSAADAIAFLASADVSDVTAVADAAARCRWVAEGEIVRLERVIGLAAANPSSVPLLQKELRFFGQAVAANPSRFVVADIGDLNEAQLHRIANAAGISMGPSSRADEAEIRRRLTEMGLSADLDRLVPDGMRAEAANLSEEFWQAMSRRVDGDTFWYEDLQAAFNALPAVPAAATA